MEEKIINYLGLELIPIREIKEKKDKTAKTETASETETSVNMDQVLQDMENLDLDVTDETGAATASDGTDATASGEESSGTESQTQETPGEAVLTGASTYMAQARIEREQIRSQNKESLLSIINNEALSETERESAIASMVNLTGETADIVVPDTQVDDASRAQIEDIVKRKTGIAAENIVITPMSSQSGDETQENQ